MSCTVLFVGGELDGQERIQPGNRPAYTYNWPVRRALSSPLLSPQPPDLSPVPIERYDLLFPREPWVYAIENLSPEAALKKILDGYKTMTHFNFAPLSSSPDQCFDKLVEHNNRAVALAQERLERITELNAHVTKLEARIDELEAEMVERNEREDI